MKSALVTLSIRPDALYAAANRIHRAYAAKWGLDYVCIDEEKYRFRPNLIRKRRVGIHCEKFQIFDLLQKYDRLIYMDSDTLIHESCPDLLDIVPLGDWACLYEDASPHNWKGLNELQLLERRIGRLHGARRRYFNAGVLVCNKSHQPVFRPDKKQILPGRWPEQTLLNYRIIAQGCSVFELDESYNYLPFFAGWQEDSVRLEKMIVHYAGTATKKQMEKDIPLHLHRWGIE